MIQTVILEISNLQTFEELVHGCTEANLRDAILIGKSLARSAKSTPGYARILITPHVEMLEPIAKYLNMK